LRVKDPVFLDTGIFIAWLVRRDKRHDAARDLMETLPATAMTSLAVVAEAYSWFLHRFDEGHARTFRLALASLPLKLLTIDVAHHRAVATKLEKLRGVKLTYVDASSLVFLKAKRIRTVWGTDRDLTIEGARLLPDDG
jgi:predicted nucleic acid-binding protein